MFKKILFVLLSLATVQLQVQGQAPTDQRTVTTKIAVPAGAAARTGCKAAAGQYAGN